MSISSFGWTRSRSGPGRSCVALAAVLVALGAVLREHLLAVRHVAGLRRGAACSSSITFCRSALGSPPPWASSFFARSAISLSGCAARAVLLIEGEQVEAERALLDGVEERLGRVGLASTSRSAGGRAARAAGPSACRRPRRRRPSPSTAPAPRRCRPRAPASVCGVTASSSSSPAASSSGRNSIDLLAPRRRGRRRSPSRRRPWRAAPWRSPRAARRAPSRPTSTASLSSSPAAGGGQLGEQLGRRPSRSSASSFAVLPRGQPAARPATIGVGDVRVGLDRRRASSRDQVVRRRRRGVVLAAIRSTIGQRLRRSAFFARPTALEERPGRGPPPRR